MKSCQENKQAKPNSSLAEQGQKIDPPKPLVGGPLHLPPLHHAFRMVPLSHACGVGRIKSVAAG